MFFISSAWGRIDGMGAFIQNTYACLPLKVDIQTRRGADQGLQGHAKRVRSPPLSWVGWATDRSEVSPASPQAPRPDLRPPPLRPYSIAYLTYTPRLSVRPTQTPSPRRALSLSLSLSLSLALCLFLSLSLHLSFSLFLSLSLKSRSLYLSLSNPIRSNRRALWEPRTSLGSNSTPSPLEGDVARSLS